MEMDLRLLQAARSGDVNILQKIAAAGDDHPSLLLGVTAENNTALHIAARRGHAELAGELCRRQRSLVVRPNSRGDTPLHCAAKAGHEEVISTLLSQLAREFSFSGLDDVENASAAATTGGGGGGGGDYEILRARNRDGDTPLHEAARNGHVGSAAELLRVDSELSSLANDAGVSPLYLAVEAMCVEIVVDLLKSPFVSYGGPNGQTALHASVLWSQGAREKEPQRGVTSEGVATSSESTPPTISSPTTPHLVTTSYLLTTQNTITHICCQGQRDKR